MKKEQKSRLSHFYCTVITLHFFFYQELTAILNRKKRRWGVPEVGCQKSAVRLSSSEVSKM